MALNIYQYLSPPSSILVPFDAREILQSPIAVTDLVSVCSGLFQAESRCIRMRYSIRLQRGCLQFYQREILGVAFGPWLLSPIDAVLIKENQATHPGICGEGPDSIV